eukprot:329930-Pyramimonas_sp.AAC.1
MYVCLCVYLYAHARTDDAPELALARGGAETAQDVAAPANETQNAMAERAKCVVHSAARPLPIAAGLSS